MATIGTFTSIETGVNALALNIKASIARIENPTDKALHYRIHAGNVELGCGLAEALGRDRPRLLLG
ncbi:uncharacterized protein (DUF736 family) [Sinorhizobium kostiense]|uniref:Uncharacterized protein (DUF736 family) n=1 Tax=Sinorhizobium kostiense TaxID=76747 RepID=A0ABS4R915_9HYPH|nr:uncharacterized protein (DUF736 family) [Sinorhizobium kostiense]